MPAPKKTPAKDAPESDDVVVEEPQTTPEEPASDEPLITAQDFIRDASHAVGVAGMLAADETLAEQKLTLPEWEQKYDQYMTSERP